MYSATSLGFSSRKNSAAVIPAARSAARIQSASVKRRPPSRLLEKLDSGRALVAVAEDELHEALPRREVRRSRPRPERVAGLAQRAPDDERVERSCRDAHALDPHDRRRAGAALGRAHV